MRKLQQRITNPLTVIAIFATLSETSAAISLPFLDDEDREIYIWFLISFPFYLLFLFFATLNFNYRSLYAPSDFENGKDFIKVMRPVHRSSNAQVPPVDIRLGAAPNQHHVRLPQRLKDLYIVDVRGMNKKIELNTSVGNIHSEQGKPAHMILFITCTESENFLRKNAPVDSKASGKHSSTAFCVAYNLNSNDVKVLNQAHLAVHNNQ